MLLWVLVNFISISFCLAQVANEERLLVEEKNVLSPPYFNIATGKQIEATATCGTDGPELFCKLTGGSNSVFGDALHQGQICDVCNANNPYKSHPVNNAIDGTEKWWQSPPLSRGRQYNRVNVTINLGQAFHVAYVLVKFANSPRAGTWVLERSSDYGVTFHPWQYFANTDSDCYNLFGMSSLEEITRDDSVICTSEYSNAVPLENGEVIVSLINGRPGAQNFSYSTLLQEWSTATHVRLRLLRTKTLLGHLMAISEEDPTVTRRYYYSIKDISIGGRCLCNGHADSCVPDPLNPYKLKCLCQHNTCGQSCERCCPGYVQKSWKAAVPGSINECEACNCHGHSEECVYDEETARRRLSLDLRGNYVGGGVCQNCQHNTAGVNCEKCASGFWRPENVDPRDPNGCRACECDSFYTLSSCEPNTGRCYCKDQYAGDRCDRCAAGYYDFPDCKRCDCYYNGTLDEVCLPVDVTCPCKYNFAGVHCDRCAGGFYNFPQCDECRCDGQGATSSHCDPYSGACSCSDGFAGARCTECSPGYFRYPFCQRCQCSDVGTTNDVCDFNTGECFCDNKFTGYTCDECKPGYFGFPQCNECACTLPGSSNNVCNDRSGYCPCLPNYQGERCQQCASGFYGYPNCIPCNCNVYGSLRRTCDSETGQCSCRENVGGRSCDICRVNYFNFPRCEECSCDIRGIKPSDDSVCLAFTTGQCDCKKHVTGVNCDQCQRLYYDLDRGCVDCHCFLPGTLDGVGECDQESGSCWCKPYVHSQRCLQCLDRFYSLQQLNYFGCRSCKCDIGGSVTLECNKITGQCQCRKGVEGRSCSSVSDGYFYPNLYQNKFEVEYSQSRDGKHARTGFNEEIFPNFSMNGYVQFSNVQHSITMPIDITNDGLYRIIFRYIKLNSFSSNGVATVIPIGSNQNGEKQSFPITFPSSSSPRVISASQTLVLNKGKWQFALVAPSGLLLDYFVLLPSEYYEANILDGEITEPCAPVLQSSRELCVMFSHFPLDSFTLVDLVKNSPQQSVAAPSTSHPLLRHLKYDSEASSNYKMTVNINLPRPGKYVLILEYASAVPKFQVAKIKVNDGFNNAKDDAKFNIYDCLYMFLCRQVALGPRNEVAVFEAASSAIEALIEAEPRGAFYVKSLTAVPFEKWKIEMVEPSRRCIAMKSPEFDRCVPSAYDFPLGSVRFPAESGSHKGSGLSPYPPTTSNVSLVYLNGANADEKSDSRLQIVMNLTPGRYVFLVHYYNPDHIDFDAPVVVDGGLATVGNFNVTFCPNENGCVGVFSSLDGDSVVGISVPSSTFTVISPTGKSFWIQDIYAVPENLYKPYVFDFASIDKSSEFVRECSQDNFYSTIENPSNFCKDNIRSLSLNYNNGALECNCSEAGTIDGEERHCQNYGGQCACKAHVIGRQCDRCMSGFFNFPECSPCDCDGKLCNPDSGECICPPNTVPPKCEACSPFTHSFHPLLGCVYCDCNVEGIVDRGNKSCDPKDGHCDCKKFITGQKCDRCLPGYFGFPNCQPCSCNVNGSVSGLCHPTSGQCLCKENVEGFQCDRCKLGSFFLNLDNPKGCTKCFCSGVSFIPECHTSYFPSHKILNMNGWSVINVKNPPVVVSEDGLETAVDIEISGGVADSSSGIYWTAPKDYLGNKLGSYGGILSFSKAWDLTQPGRGDTPDFETPVSETEEAFEVLLKGNQFTLGLRDETPDENPLSRNFTLEERNFKHLANGNNVTRGEMMMVLANLQFLRILAAPVTKVKRISLSNVTMTTTNYSFPTGSAPGIPAVEDCTCPEGYRGHSCEYCDNGYYRVNRGPFFGFCQRCDCYGHCDTCDETGQPDHCLHNTEGPNCDVCKNGYIGNATSGEVDACSPCPCPDPSKNGSFAYNCEYSASGEVICYCKAGFSGEHCDRCAVGYFGNPTIPGGSCKKCNCHGNQDPNLIMVDCDPVTGECGDCMYNTGGRYCERCADGYYGDAINAKSCVECDCIAQGTDACDHMFGYCSCKPHVIGDKCSTCEPGYYGFGLYDGCRDCSCDEAALSSECDSITGQCQCAPNVVGRRCDKCAPGHWNYSPRGCEPCFCYTYGRCDPTNGQCKCPPGVTGVQCDHCILARHVLEPGERICSRCDSCVNDLLDKVEMMTEDVRDAANQLQNTTIGIVATQRLEELQDRANQIEKTLDMNEEFLSNITEMLDKTMAEEISGSGSDLSDENEMYGDLQNRISNLETAGFKVCNESLKLLTQVESSQSRSEKTQDSSKELKTAALEFQRQTEDLIEKLSSGSSADADAKLREAEALFAEMLKRNFSSMQTIAENELQAALQVLERVEDGFTLPANNASLRVQNLLDKFEMIFDKLRELRTYMNNATATANSASTTNAINRQNLADVTTQIEDAIEAALIAGRSVDDAERLVASAQQLISGPITKGINDVNKLHDTVKDQTAILEPIVLDLKTGLERYAPLLNESIAAARELEEDAQALERLAETRFDSDFQSANRYKEITNILQQADEAADDALAAARKANDDVTGRDLQSEADDVYSRSSKLLSDSENLSNEKIKKLEEDMKKVQKNIDNVKKNKTKLEKTINKLTSDFNSLDWGNIQNDVTDVNRAVKRANKKSKQAIDEAKELEKLIENAPNSNNLNSDFREVEDMLNDLKTSVTRMKDEADRASETSRRVASLDDSLDLRGQLINIRKRIELTRSKANLIKTSMKFNAYDDSDGNYVQLRIPASVQGINKNLEASFDVQLDEASPDTQLLYYGDETRNGDYVWVSTSFGRVKYRYKVGDGVGEILSDVAIDSNKLSSIAISRRNNLAELEVTYPSDSRSDVADGSGFSNEIKTGSTDSSAIISSMNSTRDRFFVSGFSLANPPEGVLNLGTGNLCISNVRVNSEIIGLWNFKVYNGTKPGNSCGTKEFSPSNEWWRFRGQGSYLRILLNSTNFLSPSRSSHYIGFKLVTLQRNSIVFLIGNSIKQFLALQVENGKLVLYWNFDIPDGPQNATVSNFNITTESDLTSVKVGIDTRNNIVAIRGSTDEINLTKKFNGTVKMEESIWMGGVWHYDIQPELLSFLSNVDISFRGCMEGLNFNTKAFDLQNALENIGVTRGCKRKNVQPVEKQNSDYLSLIENTDATNKISPRNKKPKTRSTFGNRDAPKNKQDTKNLKPQSWRKESVKNKEDAISPGRIVADEKIAPNSNVLLVTLIVVGILVGVALVSTFLIMIFKPTAGSSTGRPNQPLLSEQTSLNNIQFDRSAEVQL